MDFCFAQSIHDSSSVVKNSDSADSRKQQQELAQGSSGGHLPVQPRDEVGRSDVTASTGANFRPAGIMPRNAAPSSVPVA
jgi:hypothetical protein